MIFKKIKSLTLLLIIVVAFFNNNAKAQTFPLTNIIVHGWQKIDALPYGVADTTLYKSVIWNTSNGKLYKIGTMGGGGSVDSLFVTYCCGCNMVDGWKALEDTIKIDTCYVNQIIKDSLNVHWVALNGLIQDTTNLVHWSDTITKIATKHDVDTLSNSIYDSLSNHYDLIHALDTGKVSTSGDVMYGKLTINADLEVNGNAFVSTIPLGTDIDSVIVMENGQLKNVDGSSFKPDSTSSGCFNNFYYKQITGCNSNNLYIKADTTKFSNNIKLPKFANNTTEPVLKVLPSGRIDTTETRSIMGLYLDSLDVGKIDASTINTDIANITTENTTYSNSTVATNQSLLLPNLGSNYKPVLSVANIGGTIDTTQVKSICTVDLDSLKIINYVVIGGVVNVDYKFTLADDGIYTFANSSYGFGSLYSFNAGKKTAFTQYSFDNDGVIYFETSTPLVVNSATDGYEICLYYSGGTYYIKNTSGGARNYILSIKYY